MDRTQKPSQAPIQAGNGANTRVLTRRMKKYHMVSNHTTFHSKALMSDDTKRKIKTINGQTLALLWRAMGLETERACDRSIVKKFNYVLKNKSQKTRLHQDSTNRRLLLNY